MAKVICVCGSGGKTTYCYKLANDYAKQNKKVCVTTTTHMYYDKKVYDIDMLLDILPGFVYTFGNVFDDKITMVDALSYKKICDRFDVVIIEADGSKTMPLKIPNIKREPVIPLNVSEIVVVYSVSAVGRSIKDVCFRYNDFKDDEYLKKNNITPGTIVTEPLIIDLYEHFYIEYFKNRFLGVKICLYRVDMVTSKNYNKYNNIAFALLCSGESKRYGEDKLKIKIDDKEMYKYMLDKILVSSVLLKKKFLDINHELNIDIVVVAKDNYILEDADVLKKALVVKNDDYKDGISASIKHVAKLYDKYDAIVYFNADMPLLKEIDIVNMIYGTMCSYKEIGVMYNEVCRTPAFFSKNYKDDLLSIRGDVGAKVLFGKYLDKIYRYHISSDNLIDIDVKADLESIRSIHG